VDTALCTWVDSSYAIHSQVAHCYNSSNVLYHGIAGASTDYERDFNAYPNAVWAKEQDPGNSSYHYYGNLNDRWYPISNWSGHPLSVRCVVALEKKSGILIQTLALCTATGSGAIFGQVAQCNGSSNILYSDACGAGGEKDCDFNAYPYALWAKEVSGSSTHNYCDLFEKWYIRGGWWSGGPFSVRCVVASKKISFKKSVH